MPKLNLIEPMPIQAIDPVCGMSVEVATAKHRAQHSGKTYHFCSAGCRTKFIASPAQYLAGEIAPMVIAKGAIYTCPMHPQIRQAGPGACPICGMALEPLVVTAEAQPNHELVDMTQRFWIGLVLTVPVFILSMGAHVTAIMNLVPMQASHWVQLVLSTPL